jgi:hypothetical protein
VYDRNAHRNKKEDDFICSTEEKLKANANKSNTLKAADDQTLRTFRVAISSPFLLF